MTTYSCETQPAVVPHYQDVVKFRFTGPNAFYEKVCEDKAVVIGQLSSGDEYHLLLKCGTSFRSIWVRADDIVEIVPAK
jgi:hypothetical protein